jgi:hypothetical protein
MIYYNIRTNPYKYHNIYSVTTSASVFIDELLGLNRGINKPYGSSDLY